MGSHPRESYHIGSPSWRRAADGSAADGILVEMNRSLAIDGIVTGPGTETMAQELTGRLFNDPDDQPHADPAAPLADRMRPASLEEFIGQDHLVGAGALLSRLIAERKPVPSLILWGGPGTGKTTLARLLANSTGAEFVGALGRLRGRQGCSYRDRRSPPRCVRAGANRPLHRRDPSIQQGPAGCALAERRERHRHADRGDDREPLFRGDGRPALAEPGLDLEPAGRKRPRDDRSARSGRSGARAGRTPARRARTADRAPRPLIGRRRPRGALGPGGGRGRDGSRRRRRAPRERVVAHRSTRSRPIRLRPSGGRPLQPGLGADQVGPELRCGRLALLARPPDRRRCRPALHRAPALHPCVRGRRPGATRRRWSRPRRPPRSRN